MLRRLFGRTPAVRPDYLDQPDAVLPGDPHAKKIAEIDDRLRLPLPTAMRDWLLDERLRLRPARPAVVPVIPGGGS
jgi:hypothetical protein